MTRRTRTRSRRPRRDFWDSVKSTVKSFVTGVDEDDISQYRSGETTPQYEQRVAQKYWREHLRTGKHYYGAHWGMHPQGAWRSRSSPVGWFRTREEAREEAKRIGDGARVLRIVQISLPPEEFGSGRPRKGSKLRVEENDRGPGWIVIINNSIGPPAPQRPFATEAHARRWARNFIQEHGGRLLVYDDKTGRRVMGLDRFGEPLPKTRARLAPKPARRQPSEKARSKIKRRRSRTV